MKKLNLTNQGRSRAIKISLIAIFTCLVIAGGFIKIPLPLIPFTMQTFAVQLTATMLGPLYGALAICLYLFIGLCGVPIFTNGGGFMYVLQPTFGYMIGFLIGTIVSGFVLRFAKKQSYWTYLICDIINMLIIYACGMIYFYFLQTFYFGKAVSAYTIFVTLFLVFVPGDLACTFLAAYIAKRLNPILDKIVYQVATDKDIAALDAENSNIDSDDPPAEATSDIDADNPPAKSTSNINADTPPTETTSDIDSDTPPSDTTT